MQGVGPHFLGCDGRPARPGSHVPRRRLTTAAHLLQLAVDAWSHLSCRAVVVLLSWVKRLRTRGQYRARLLPGASCVRCPAYTPAASPAAKRPAARTTGASSLRVGFLNRSLVRPGGAPASPRQLWWG